MSGLSFTPITCQQLSTLAAIHHRCPLTALCCSSLYAPELDDPEVAAGFRLLDTNNDGRVEFGEFVAYWTDRNKKLRLPSSA